QVSDEFIASPGGDGEPDPTRPRFTDKRRIDPETGEVRSPAPTTDGGDVTDAPEPTSTPDDAAAAPAEGIDAAGEGSAELEEARRAAAERLEDLQRLQAEYVNYRKRVERDRLVARDQTVVAV